MKACGQPGLFWSSKQSQETFHSIQAHMHIPPLNPTNNKNCQHNSPGNVQGQWQAVDVCIEHLGQLHGNHQCRVGIIALAHVQQTGQLCAWQGSKVLVKDAELAAAQSQHLWAQDTQHTRQLMYARRQQ